MEELNIAALNPPMRITRINPNNLDILIDYFSRVKARDGVIGWDIETTPTKDFYFRRVRTIQFGDSNEQYVIDLKAFAQLDTPPHGLPASDILYDAQGHYGKNLTPNLKRLIETITPVLSTTDFLKVGVNLAFEYMTFYWCFGLRTYHFWDCSVVEKVIQAGYHSLKDYSYYGMEEMMERYFQVHIDKKYQESFNLEDELIDEQIEYAALDTRFPFALKKVQEKIIAGETNHVSLQRIDPLVLGDNLQEICQIENDAIGAFQDMHVHGERIDKEKWLIRVNANKAEFERVIHEELDPIFLPIVGTKFNIITDEDIEAARAKWKVYTKPSAQEVRLKAEIRNATTPEFKLELEEELANLVGERLVEKELLKKEQVELGKRRTKIRKLAAQCEGEALINYGSNAQLLEVLNTMPQVKLLMGKKKDENGKLVQVKLDTLDDEVLEKYESIAVFAAIKKYHKLNKQIGTYGEAWVTQWKTKPCKEEGWLHPGDGRLHSVFNQQNAETGRSSSEKPNGQNIEAAEEVRSCFIADPPDESIRISDCCDADTVITIHPLEISQWAVECTKCKKVCEFHETHAEEYVIVTADMSGAELRIIAELADDPVWIGAFGRGEDVHSVGTELLFEDEWESIWRDINCDYFKLHTEETVAKNPLCILGDLQRQKCKCPQHKERREDNKRTNFLLAYGGGPGKLSKEIGKSFKQAKALMSKHEEKNPLIWKFLKESGEEAERLKKSFDMFGRRRGFPRPTHERALSNAIANLEEELRLSAEEVARKEALFFNINGTKPNKDQEWLLTHRMPTAQEIGKEFNKLSWSIERQGKNHKIQGTNATIAKKAMGAGYDPNGQPYLWHTLPQYKAKLIKFVHDELVVQCPKRFGTQVAALIGDAFKRAAAEKMKKVIMEFGFEIDSYWKKG